MERNRPPALTSPWKIGFFVSLLLVALSIGVGFFMTRSFDVSWTWIEFPDASWRTWKFHLDSFMHEMLPLVLVVPLFSLVSFFLIAGAVRKYKAYLDSGLDYKNLVQSIRRIEDLEDEGRIKKLKNHPELRDSLLKLRDRIETQEKELAEREKSLQEKAERARESEGNAAEVDVLLSAIAAGRNGFGGELALRSEQLKKVEHAIRNSFVSADTGARQDIDETLDNLRAEFVEKRTGLNHQLHEIRTELAACNDAARELEAHANRAGTEVRASGGDDTAAVAKALGSLDEIAQMLSALGEEAKAIAINTAMQASTGGNAELVGFAEQVRDVAGRFSGAAQQWTASTSAVRKSIDASAAGDTGGGADAVAALAKQISMWVERTVVLAEKIRAFDEKYAETSMSLEVKLGGRPDPSVFTSGADIDGIGSPEGRQPKSEGDDFVRQEKSRMLNDDPSSSAIIGIEKDPDPLEELATAQQDDDTEMFAAIPERNAEDEPAAEEMFEEMAHDQPTADSELSDEAVGADEGFVTDPAVAAPEPAEVEPARTREPSSFQSTTFEADETGSEPADTEDEAEAEEPTADVIDLYALGAVDYVAGVHQ